MAKQSISDEINKLFDSNYNSTPTPVAPSIAPSIPTADVPLPSPKKRGWPAGKKREKKNIPTAKTSYKKSPETIANMKLAAKKRWIDRKSREVPTIIVKKRGRPPKIKLEAEETKSDDRWKNYKKSPETIEKIRAAVKKRWAEKKSGRITTDSDVPKKRGRPPKEKNWGKILNHAEKVLTPKTGKGAPGRPKGPMSEETKEKIRQAVQARWDAKHKKQNVLKDRIEIDYSDREDDNKIKIPELNPRCHFCNFEMQKLIKGYYYCEHCNIIVNPALRWRVKLPI